MATTQPVYHRGVVLGDLEENTMGAFRAAGARDDGFELDIHPTFPDSSIPGDVGTICVIHDSTWTRTCNLATIPVVDPEAWVASTTQAQVNGVLTNGGSTIPSLKQALGLNDVASPILIDIKISDPWTDEMLTRIDDLIVTTGAQYRHFVFLNDMDLWYRLRALAPNARLSYRPVGDMTYNLDGTLAMGAKAIQPEFSTLTRAKVDRFQSAGIKVIVQGDTLSGKPDLDKCRNWGVNYVLIDADKWDLWT